MKSICLIPLLFLSACSTTPKLAVYPQSSSLAGDTVRYPEVVRAYHFGRYVDPNDESVMHEQHTVFRVEENTRWSLRTRTLSAALGQFQTALAQTKTNLQETAVLHAAVNDMKHRLDTLEAAPEQLPATPLSATNAPPDPLSP